MSTRTKKKINYEEKKNTDSGEDFSADEDDDYVDEDHDIEDEPRTVSRKRTLRKILAKVVNQENLQSESELVQPESELVQLESLSAQPDPVPETKREVYLGIINGSLYLADPPASKKITSNQWRMGMQYIYFTESNNVCNNWYGCNICGWLIYRETGGSTGNIRVHVEKHSKELYTLTRTQLAQILSKATTISQVLTESKVKKLLPPPAAWSDHFLDDFLSAEGRTTDHAVQTEAGEVDSVELLDFDNEQLQKIAYAVIQRKIAETEPKSKDASPTASPSKNIKTSSKSRSGKNLAKAAESTGAEPEVVSITELPASRSPEKRSLTPRKQNTAGNATNSRLRKTLVKATKSASSKSVSIAQLPASQSPKKKGSLTPRKQNTTTNTTKPGSAQPPALSFVSSAIRVEPLLQKASALTKSQELRKKLEEKINQLKLGMPKTRKDKLVKEINKLEQKIGTTKTSEENVHTKVIEPEPHESDAPIENSGAEVSGEFVQSSDSNDDSDIDSTSDMDEIVGNVETDIDQVLSNQKELISDDVDNNIYVFSDDKMAEKDRLFSLLKAKYRNEIVTKINKINHEMTDLSNKGYLVPVLVHRRQYRLQMLRTEMDTKIKRAMGQPKKKGYVQMPGVNMVRHEDINNGKTTNAKASNTKPNEKSKVIPSKAGKPVDPQDKKRKAEQDKEEAIPSKKLLKAKKNVEPKVTPSKIGISVSSPTKKRKAKEHTEETIVSKESDQILNDETNQPKRMRTRAQGKNQA